MLIARLSLLCPFTLPFDGCFSLAATRQKQHCAHLVPHVTSKPSGHTDPLLSLRLSPPIHVLYGVS